MTVQGMYNGPATHQKSDPNRPEMSPELTNIRVYQLWKGNNRFFFGGRLIFGPDVRSIFLTSSLIVVPVILFCVFVSQRLIHEVQQLGTISFTICICFTIYVIFLLLLTSGRDPGIIPRNLHPPEIDDDCDLSSISSDWPTNQSTNQNIPPTKDVMVNGILVRVKYCHTCMLYRPPRCSHCSICNNCVERFDHHCPWVGQCIGKRNYRFFFMFVSSTTMLCLYVFTFCWINIKHIMDVYNCNLWRAFEISPISGVLMLYTFVASWFVGGLTAFHFYLIATNQTTYENFRYRYGRKRNPYNRGCLRNIGGIFFSKIPRSKNKFWDTIKPEMFASISRGRNVSRELGKESVDLELGKRQAEPALDFEELQNRIDKIGWLERCETAQRHSYSYWESSPDIQTLFPEFGLELGLSEREKKQEDPST